LSCGCGTGGADSTESTVTLPAVAVVWRTDGNSAGLAAEVSEVDAAAAEDTT